jgi:Glycosyltransferase family 92
MKIAAACIFRDEARYLKEWIEFHRVVGIERFYMSNNLSSDSYLEVLQPYIDQGIVQLNQITSLLGMTGACMLVQKEAFTWGVKKAIEDGIDWLALLNSDEFLHPTKANTLQEVLDKGILHDVSPHSRLTGQVSVNWRMMGHSFKRLEPGQLLVEHLTMSQGHDGENMHVKAIVRPLGVDDCTNAHFVTLKHGFKTVNSIGQERIISGPPWQDPVQGTEYHRGPFDLPVRRDSLLINHYTMRDESFSDLKCDWYRSWGYAAENIKILRDRANDVENLEIQRFLPALKERMKCLTQ